jgi:23S rRNA pseudouridine1911/1915/1917 synthase
VTESPSQVRRFRVEAEDSGQRLDRWLAAHLPELSRTRIQEQIAQGRVQIGGSAVRASRRIEGGETIEIEIAAPPSLHAVPEPIPLEILHEDDDLVAVNKPAGMVVHPGAGIGSGTLANALAYRYRRLSAVGGPARPGIVHRLDKYTSGVIVVARNDEAHRRLAREFAERRVGKVYLALVHGRVEHDTGRIDLAIARDLRRRTRMTTRRREGRQALTTWRVLLRLGREAEKGSSRKRPHETFTLVEANLHTGRTHQIRVHFSAMGHPVAGDTRYGAPRRIVIGGNETKPLDRFWLHAARLRLAHPRTGQMLEIRAPLPPELRDWLAALAELFGSGRAEIDRVLRGFL